ncbi:MAG: hypothetical protein ACLPKB_24005 [Xanthobacteraceae bacterium]
MNKYLQTAAITILVLGCTALADAQSSNPNEGTTDATVDLTPEQEGAIYRAVIDARGERSRPEVRLGDEAPSRVKLSTLPDSLQIQIDGRSERRVKLSAVPDSLQIQIDVHKKQIDILLPW